VDACQGALAHRNATGSFASFVGLRQLLLEELFALDSLRALPNEIASAAIHSVDSFARLQLPVFAAAP
jgi:hypothetical protein